MKKKRIKKPKIFEQYIEWLIQEGYTKENGEPIKCEKCGCKKFKNENYYCGESWVEEHTVKCKSCGTIVGHMEIGKYKCYFIKEVSYDRCSI